MLRRNQKNLIYLLVLLTPFLIFLVRSDSLVPLKSGLIQGLSLPIHLIAIPLDEIKKILFYHRIHNEYKRLRKETGELKAKLVGMEEIIHENTRLEQLLQFKRNLVYSSVAANVIGRDPAGWNSSIIIDRGTRDGIGPGMPVISTLGVVGRVAEAAEQYSKVILLTDPQFSVAAVVQGSREIGLVSGSLQGEICRLRFIGFNSPVSVGDKVVTSELSTFFPEGLLIGEILQIVEDSHKPTIECIIKPSVVLSQLEEILVIRR